MSVKNTLKISRDFGHIVMEIKAPSIERFFASVGTPYKVEKWIQENINSRNRDEYRGAAYKAILPFEVEGASFDTFYILNERMNLFANSESEKSRGNRFDVISEHARWFYTEEAPRINIFFLQFKGIGEGVTLKFRGMFQDEVVSKIAETLKQTFNTIVNLSKPCTIDFSVEENELTDSDTETILE